jgi:hypothetical protein
MSMILRGLDEFLAVPARHRAVEDENLHNIRITEWGTRR